MEAKDDIITTRLMAGLYSLTALRIETVPFTAGSKSSFS
jgi:hypothetical protein